MNTKRLLYKALTLSCKEDNPGIPIVFGQGNLDAEIMFVGEALGKDEVKLKCPFVGAAGQKLNEFLDTAGIIRDNVYITNVVKKRPLDDSVSYPKNRTPNDEEIRHFSFYLEKELELISPSLIITLGSIPLKYFCGPSMRISKVHGTYISKEKYDLFFLYHPAAVLYKKELLDIYVQDVMQLKEYLGS